MGPIPQTKFPRIGQQGRDSSVLMVALLQHGIQRVQDLSTRRADASLLLHRPSHYKATDTVFLDDCREVLDDIVLQDAAGTDC